jgi:periplasmic protein CpxP/Spy
MMKRLVSVLALVAIGLGALTLTAFRHHHDPAQMEQRLTKRVEKMLDEVQATDAQRQQILAIKDKLVADGKALHATRADTRQKLLALWNSDQPDAAQVHALVDGRADAMKAFADEVADAILQVHGILTPAQRAQVGAKVQQHLEQHGQHGGSN